MKELVKISCYIEEYSNQNGKLCARLRDKASNKKVVLMGHNTDYTSENTSRHNANYI